MEVDIRMITPEIADEMLSKNTNNRNISAAKLLQYTRDMQEGRWKESGNTISVGPSGRLLNGQHRLMALREAGISMEFIIVTEDNDEVFDVFDTGLNRNLSLLLKMHGVTSPLIAGGIAKLVMSYDKNPNLVWHESALTRYEKMDFAIANKEQTEVCSQMASVFGSHMKAGKNWYAALMFLILRDSGNKEKLDIFHKSMCEGVGMGADDPRLAFRNYLIRNGAPGTFWEQQSYLALGIIAWNDWINGNKRQQVRWMRTSLPMPVVDATDNETAATKKRTRRATTTKRVPAKRR